MLLQIQLDLDIILILRMQNNNMDAKNFDKIDKNKSGKLDQQELNNYFGNNEIMKLGDLNNDNEIDFSEFERVVNIDKFGIEMVVIYM